MKMAKESHIERLKQHLELLERETGRPLRTRWRYGAGACPIANFAPNDDANGYMYGGSGLGGILGIVIYKSPNNIDALTHEIYREEDSDWWLFLSYSRQCAITREIIKWLKDRQINENSL